MSRSNLDVDDCPLCRNGHVESCSALELADCIADLLSRRPCSGCCPNGCRPQGLRAAQGEVTDSARRLVHRTARREAADLPTFWRQADGTEIPIAQMSDRHLLNSYRMMRRNGYVEVETLRLYLLGPEPTAEMAYDAYRQEQSEVFSRKAHPLMDGLRREIDRRGLRR